MARYEAYIYIWNEADYATTDEPKPIKPSGRILEKACQAIYDSVSRVNDAVAELTGNRAALLDCSCTVEDDSDCIKVELYDEMDATAERISAMNKLLVYDPRNGAGWDGEDFFLVSCENGIYTGGRDNYQMSCEGIEEA